MSPRTKPADVRFYFDADVLGLAKVLVQLRPDITYPGDPGGVVHRRRRPACPITSPATLDVDWIPAVAKAGWLIITRDSHIQDHRAEIAAVRENAGKMVALAGREALNTWNPARSPLHAMASHRTTLRTRRSLHLRRNKIRAQKHQARLTARAPTSKSQHRFASPPRRAPALQLTGG